MHTDLGAIGCVEHLELGIYEVELLVLQRLVERKSCSGGDRLERRSTRIGLGGKRFEIGGGSRAHVDSM